MAKMQRLADFDHSLVIKTAKDAAGSAATDRDRLRQLFFYVRDEILFGFPANGDLVKASDTIRLKMGQCNTKGTLFLALCKALGIPARMHFSAIRREIQRGLFVGPMYRLMPETISHAWLEVEIDGVWRRLDSYINDESFYLAGRVELKARGWETGFSVSCAAGESGAEFSIDREKFVQMGAVTEDHGVWDEPADYYNSGMYRNRPGILKLLIYRLAVGRINRRVNRLRMNCRAGLCGHREVQSVSGS